MRRWPLEEIGRNSVSPCTRPSTIASRVLIAAHPMAGAKQGLKLGSSGNGGGVR